MLLRSYLIMGQTGFHRCVLRRRFFLVCAPTPLTSDALQQPPPLIGLRENITPMASIAIQLRKIRTVRTKVITPPPINRYGVIFLQFYKQSNGYFVTNCWFCQ